MGLATGEVFVEAAPNNVGEVNGLFVGDLDEAEFYHRGDADLDFFGFGGCGYHVGTMGHIVPKVNAFSMKIAVDICSPLVHIVPHEQARKSRCGCKDAR